MEYCNVDERKKFYFLSLSLCVSHRIKKTTNSTANMKHLFDIPFVQSLWLLVLGLLEIILAGLSGWLYSSTKQWFKIMITIHDIFGFQ